MNSTLTQLRKFFLTRKHFKRTQTMLDLNAFDFNSLSSSENPFGEQEKTSASVDERFYKMKRDENGNGVALIRFLPDPNMKLMQQVFRINVNANKNGERRWVSELSPQTIGKPCPFHEEWARLWNSGQKDESRQYARQTRYYANILVLKDPAQPECEGKVFLLDIGKKLKEKLEQAMMPNEMERSLGATPKALFNPLQGNSFKLVSKKEATGFLGFDSSAVVEQVDGVFQDKETAVKFIKENCHDLGEFLKPEAYKSYDELKEKLNYVQYKDVGAAPSSAPQKSAEVIDVTQQMSDLDKQQNADLDAFLANV